MCQSKVRYHAIDAIESAGWAVESMVQVRTVRDPSNADVLRRYDLLELYKRNTDECLNRLQELASNEQGSEKLYALRNWPTSLVNELNEKGNRPRHWICME